MKESREYLQRLKVLWPPGKKPRKIKANHMSHEKRCEKAKTAIDKVFSDTPVLLVTLLRSLHDLRDHLDYVIDTVESDIDI
jgi:hypothetical protein